MKATVKAQKGVVVIEVTDDDGKPLHWEVWKDGALIGTYYKSVDEALEEYKRLIDSDNSEQPIMLPQEKSDTGDSSSDKQIPFDPLRPS